MAQLISKDLSQSVPTTGSVLTGPNAKRLWLAFCNNGTTDVWIAFGRDAEADHGIVLKAGGGTALIDMKLTPWFEAVHAIAITNPVNLAVTEVEVQQ